VSQEGPAPWKTVRLSRRYRHYRGAAGARAEEALEVGEGFVRTATVTTTGVELDEPTERVYVVHVRARYCSRFGGVTTMQARAGVVAMPVEMAQLG
jgi:hypothetical protein